MPWISNNYNRCTYIVLTYITSKRLAGVGHTIHPAKSKNSASPYLGYDANGSLAIVWHSLNILVPRAANEGGSLSM